MTSPSFYVATAHKPTAVDHCARGHFTGAEDINLILGKCSRLEIMRLKDDGLEAMMEVPLNGRIDSLELFRPVREPRDLLLVVTERGKFCVLAFNPDSSSLETRATGDLNRPARRAVDVLGSTGLVEPLGRMLGFLLYQGHFDSLRIDERGKAFPAAVQMRLAELQVLALCFLHVPANVPPTLAVLHRDFKRQMRVAIYTVDDEKKVLEESGWSCPDALDPGSMALVPVGLPLGGLIVAGGESVVYLRGRARTGAVPPPPRAAARLPPSTEILATATIDQSRYLLGDSRGSLYVVVLRTDGGERGQVVSGLEVAELGITSPASAISYLDSGVVFVGSAHGPSQLIRLLEVPDDSGSSVEVIETFHSLAPVLDLSVADVNQSGADRLLACCGGMGRGSLNAISCGAQVEEMAEVDMPGIKGLWSMLGAQPEDGYKYLAQSFVGETRVLALVDSSLEEVEAGGFDSSQPSLYCGSVAGGRIVQVTPLSVRVMSGSGPMDLEAEWRPEDGGRITLAHANAQECLVVVGGRRLVLLSLADRSSVRAVSVVDGLEHEVSCLDISQVAGFRRPDGGARYAVLGLWGDLSVRVLELPTLRPASRTTLEGEVIPRSVLQVNLSGLRLVLVGTGDGFLAQYSLAADGTLARQNRLNLGTQPIVLVPLEGNGGDEPATRVVACCDRPALVTVTRGQVSTVNLNLADLNFAAPFSSADFPGCVAVATESHLAIRALSSNSQQLNYQRVAVDRIPRFVAYQRESGTYAISSDSGDPLEPERVALLDQQSLRELSSFALGPNENLVSLISTTLVGLASSARSQEAQEMSGTKRHRDEDGGDRADAAPASAAPAPAPAPAGSSSADAMDVDSPESDVPVQYFVAGTAFPEPPDADGNPVEPRRGRIVVLRVVNGQLELCHEEVVNGAVYALAGYQNERLVAGVNATVRMYAWVDPARQAVPSAGRRTAHLEFECDHHGNILVVQLAVEGTEILVGDITASVMVLRFEALPRRPILVEVARDFHSSFVRTATIAGRGVYLVSEERCNLFVAERQHRAASEEEKSVLKVTGRFHLGDSVNVVRPGSIGMRYPEADPWATRSFVAGTISGAIILIAELTSRASEVLARVEAQLAELIHPVGALSHKDWRSPLNDYNHKAAASSGFVDGDLVERFVALPPHLQSRVADAVGLTVDELSQRIEGLVRLH